MEFTHFDDLGNARMVDVSDKSVTGRSAYAVGTIRMNREAFSAITGGKVRKGDVLTVAQVARSDPDVPRAVSYECEGDI